MVLEAEVCLVVIYNHNYEKNIDVVERLYSSRFTKIVHVMPFYKGTRKNVVPVYGNSFYFSGYIAQAASHLSSIHVTSFVFIADDLILSPRLNDGNILRELSLDAETAFIPDIRSLSRDKLYWPHARKLLKWKLIQNGLEVQNMIPSTSYSKLKFTQLLNQNVDVLPVEVIYPKPTRTEFLRRSNGFRGTVKWLSLTLMYFLKRFIKRNESLPYPFLRSYSDIFVIPKKSFTDFAHMCGIFAATELFVEVAIPTSMALTQPKIKTEKQIGKYGLAIWGHDRVSQILISKYNKDMTSLLQDFPRDSIYIHPIKLSEWRAD
jgi:hypothetical protein